MVTCGVAIGLAIGGCSQAHSHPSETAGSIAPARLDLTNGIADVAMKAHVGEVVTIIGWCDGRAKIGWTMTGLRDAAVPRVVLSSTEDAPEDVIDRLCSSTGKPKLEATGVLRLYEPPPDVESAEGHPVAHVASAPRHYYLDTSVLTIRVEDQRPHLGN